MERFINRLTDMDAGWWPVLSLRPKKTERMDARVVLKLSMIYGPGIGIVLIAIMPFICESLTVTPVHWFLSLVYGVIVFFMLYTYPFAYYWNVRAKRLRAEEGTDG